MGVNKKFLLLALLVLTNVSYSKTVTSGTGIWAAGKEGVVQKNDELEVKNGAIGINVKFEKGKEGTGINNGVIKVSDKNSKGIFINNSSTSGEKNSAKNENRIEVSKNGIGVYFNGGSDGNFYNNKDMIITDKDSKGIFLNSKGNAENNGNISIEAGAIGVQNNNDNAVFSNNSNGIINVSGENSKGIQLNKGMAKNDGVIKAIGRNTTGVYVNAGSGAKKNEFINNNKLIASGKGAKGIQFGSGSGKVVNNKDIKAENEAIGVFFYQGKNNILINSGVIDAGNGFAIDSGKGTNNTVVFKKDSKVIGNIRGNDGVDVLAVEGGSEYKDLAITGYDKIVSLKAENSTDDAVISNSNISLEYNKDTDKYVASNKELDGEKTGLTIKNSNLVVDLQNRTENSSLIDTGKEKLTLDGNIKIAFNGSKGEKEFNISEILGDEIEAENVKFESSAMWEYEKNADEDLIARKKSYTETVGKSELSDFGKVLEQNSDKGGDFGKGLTLLGLLDASQFTDAMTQLSGGVHGYTVDFTALNSRTLSNTIKNIELSKDRTREKSLNSYNQDVVYIKNNHKLSGLMNVDYDEDGVLGITEKQIMTNGKLGLVYGGAKGKAKFENGKNGKADMDTLYLGGYYAYDFSDKLTLVSNANFVYSHTNVTRNIKFAKDNQYLDYSYESAYPVFGFGGGATLYYTPYNGFNNSVTLYGGIDWTKIVQGNINENSDKKEDKLNENLTIKNIPVDEQMYDSLVPHIGVSLSNNGYIFNKKYRLGVNVDYETELGNIKNGKKLKLSSLDTAHRVETTKRENIVSYSLNGALDLTEDFTIYGNYTKANSDEYDAEKVEAGFKYKMERMSDVFITAPLLSQIENRKSYSDRWTGVFGVVLEAEDDSDRSYYTEPIMGEEHSRGDYATSLKLKPKFTLSLKDKKTNWSYYFETYYMSNNLGIELDKNERRKSESRLHGEARWSDQYSKGRYGFNIGYRNEITSAPTLSQYVGRDRLERGLHQFRFTPNFTYNLGNGFIFGGQTTGIIAYDYEGYRKGQTDFELENEYGITYNGLMPRWRFNLNYFREETWFDKDFRKPDRTNPQPGVYKFENVEGDRRYQSNQLRPRVTYFFGNGGRVELSARIPLGNGYWYNSDDNNKKTAEKYETRYGIKYYQPIAPGLTGMIGGEILTIKTKTTSSGVNYGKETRDYSIRPTVGISYNF